MKRIIGKINSDERHVTIWGAGFAGLTLGYFLKEQGYRITIYERSNRPGGKIQTKKTGYGPVETGPNALYLNSDGLQLIKDLKLVPIPAARKLKRLLMLNGRPKKAWEIRIFSRLLVNGLKKPPLISDGLTVSDFFMPLLGNDLIRKYLSPILGGIYAAPSEGLHFKSVFDEVNNKAQFESYWEFIRFMMKFKKNSPKLELSGSVTFEGGMQALINRLAEVLKPEIKYNYKEGFRIKGNTIVCTDALSASDLVKDLRPGMAAELKRIRYQELSSVTVFLKREIKTLQRAFGVLIPRGGDYNSMGVINNKAVFPDNNQNVFSYTLIGPKKVDEDEVRHDLRLLYPEFVPEDIELMEIHHWAKAVPLYDLQRYLSVKKMHQIAQEEENFAIFGNYVAGISLREMISAAKKFSQNPNHYMEK